MGHISVVKHEIKLNDYSIHVASRPVSYHLRDNVKNQLEMLRLGIIAESQNPWSFPILLVPKANGHWRFCIDFRRLNERSIKDTTPCLPSTIFLLKLVAPKFSQLSNSLQAISRYQSLKKRELTVFSVGNRHYEFLKMPGTLRNSRHTCSIDESYSRRP